MKISSFDPLDDGLNKVALRTCVKDNIGLAAGEITVAGKIDFESDVRGDFSAWVCSRCPRMSTVCAVQDGSV